MKLLEAFNKLDHTLCLNSPILKFNIDDERLYGTPMFEGEYDPSDTDCKSMDEMMDCLNIVEEALNEYEDANRERIENALAIKAFEIIKKKGLSHEEIFWIEDNCPYARYLDLFSDYPAKTIKTEEEYELLKKALR